ncbi:helix-turn-helix domain-containing protein [Pedobacter frigiditerrae]|uniref:helix-turn-helix domain-containing protein n=1 Tax=Pedobacter frigiditerrae TaxID=2530452 RepID=UPI00292D5CE5|nr:helix-turn-helix domain-containing protein [Pedobacter frigiditerrae]
MENIFLTSLTVPEVREQFKKVLTEFFSEYNLSAQSNSNEPEQRFTRTELAKYLGVTLPTVDRYRERNVFPYYQTGRTIYFKKNEVDNALSVGKRKGR